MIIINNSENLRSVFMKIFGNILLPFLKKKQFLYRKTKNKSWLGNIMLPFWKYSI